MADKLILLGFENVVFDPIRGLWEEVRAALAELFLHNSPVVLWSSLNRAEAIYYRGQLGLREPFVVENGAGIYTPLGFFDFDTSQELAEGHEFLRFGVPSNELRAEIEEAVSNQSVPVHFIEDYSADELGRLYKMPPHLADLKQRLEFSAAFTTAPYHDDSWETTFVHLAERCGCWLRFDGVFYSVQKKLDPARPFEALVRLFERSQGSRPKIVAVGGTTADHAVLALADEAIWVKNDRLTAQPEPAPPKAFQTEKAGPEAWKEVLTKILA